ncbi:MAG: agglutinin biosis protein MshI [Burkholderia sp.]|nr:agglutinin biosis protein MshI [Burkholderia sp.]
MKFFSQNKKVPGWMAVCLKEDGIYAAHIKRMPSARPVVELHAFFFAEAASAGEALERLAKELQPGRYQCTTLLNTGEYQLLSVDAPNVPPDELKAAIRWRMKDMIDYHIDDATFDVLDVPAEKNATARNHTMYAVAARNQLIQSRQSLFEEAKIPLRAIDIPEMAQRNISILLEPENRGIGLLSFGHDGGLLTITFEGELYLSRRLDVTLSQLQNADEVQKETCYDRITLELQRSFDHLDRQYHFIALSKLLLGPSGNAGSGLQQYLAKNLYIPVESLDLDSVVDLSRAPELKSPDLQQRYFLTIGAALRHEETAL